MSTSHEKIVGLSAALAALAGPAAMLPTTAAANTTDADARAANPAGTTRPTVIVAVGDEFMHFTVGDNAKGMVVADHSSHASHASHASHSSHSSHYSSR